MSAFDDFVTRHFARDAGERALLADVAKRADAMVASGKGVDLRAFVDAPNWRLNVGQALVVSTRKSPALPAMLAIAAVLYAAVIVFLIVACFLF